MKTRLILSTTISIALFIGGTILLISPLGFWSYFLGIPSVQIGIIFIIFTFEKILDRSEEILEKKEE